MHFPQDRPIAARQSGFTLVELMIALVLGLLVVAAAGGVFLSNRQVFATTGSLNRIQENARAAYEILARDIREAGANPCGSNLVNMLPVAERSPQWTAWMVGIGGAEGGTSTPGDRKPDSITLHSASGDEVAVESQDGPSADLVVTTNAGFKAGDVLMICNPQVSSLFKVTSLPKNGLGHNSGEGGNIIKPFQVSQEDIDNYKEDSGGNAIGYCFTTKDGKAPDNPADPQSSTNVHTSCTKGVGNAPASVVRPMSVRWEIAANNNNGHSLYRVVMSGDGAQRSRDEIAAGVIDMQLRYKLNGSDDLVDATEVGANWGRVNAVDVTLVLEAEAGVSRGRDLDGTTQGQRLQRTMSSLVAIRNREGIL